MGTEIWIIIGIVVVVVWGMMIWEMVNSPIYPDDYGEETEYETSPHNEKSPPSSQTYSGNLEYKHWKYPTTDCRCEMGVKVEKHTKCCGKDSWKNEGYPNPEFDRQKMKQEDQEWSQDNWDNGLRRIFHNKVLEQSEKIQELMRLQTELEILHNHSDISFDVSAQNEYHRIQERIEKLMGNSSKVDNKNNKNMEN